MQLHAEPEVVIEFQVIRTKMSRNLTMTSRHLIYKADSEIASSQPVLPWTSEKETLSLSSMEKIGMIKDEAVRNNQDKNFEH